MLAPADNAVSGGREHPRYGYVLSAASIVTFFSLCSRGREFASAVEVNDKRREMLILNDAACSDLARLFVIGQGSRRLRDKCRGSHHGIVPKRRVN